MRRLFVLLLSACSLDEAGTATSLTDAGIDVVSKDVTVLDVVGSDTTQDVIQDVTPDVPPPPCNPTAPFGNANAISGLVNTGVYEANPMLSPDELMMFFTRDTGSNRLGLFYATRPSRSQPFGQATELSLSTNQTSDTSSWVDGTLSSMLFASARSGDTRYHLYQATGNGQPDGWSNITKLTTLDWVDPATDFHPWMAPVTGEVWFASDRLGSLDLYVAAGTKGTPSFYAPLSTNAAETHPVLTANALTIFFARDDLQNKSHVFVATRATTTSLFQNPTQVTELDQAGTQSAPGWISADGCRMYFITDRSGNSDIWMATRGS